MKSGVNMCNNLYKKFSIGLNLEEEQDVFALIEEYHSYLSSVYFSLPLGNKFYSRNELKHEYEEDDAEEKLFRVVRKLRKSSVKTEVAINSYGLNEGDICKAIEYMQKKEFYPDEIVCLNEYVHQLKENFPESEMKCSFNNIGKPSPLFDTIVVGKEYIRNRNMRKKIVDSGKSLVLLLNNGCSFECRGLYCDAKTCSAIFQNNIKKNNVNYLYALQSLFPSELQRILIDDDYSDIYRFKLSNRPLGLDFTRKLLNAYCGLSSKNELEIIIEDKSNYGLFCVMDELYKRRYDFSLEEICLFKEKLDV